MRDRKSFLLDEETYRGLVRETVHETLVGLGFDMQDPQKLQADMHYLRKMRSGSEDVGRIIQRSAITLSFTTALYLMWEAVKTILQC